MLFCKLFKTCKPACSIEYLKPGKTMTSAQLYAGGLLIWSVHYYIK